MIYVLWYLTEGKSVFLAEILDQSSCNSTGVSSGVSLEQKIERKIEHDMGKTDYRTQKYV